MKRVSYQCLYKRLSFLSNGFDNRYLRKYRVLLGTTLLVLIGACQSPKKDNPGENYVLIDVIETMPEFPGGTEALMNYIQEKLVYPQEALKEEIQGRVAISFIVERDGSVSSAEVRRSIDASLDKEALRIIRSMPKWKPAKLNGKAIKVRYIAPVQFRLPDKSTEK